VAPEQERKNRTLKTGGCGTRPDENARHFAQNDTLRAWRPRDDSENRRGRKAPLRDSGEQGTATSFVVACAFAPVAGALGYKGP